MDASPAPGRARQRALFVRGLGGVRPAVPVGPEALEAAARQRLPPEAFAYLAGGAGMERTMAANRAAFDRWRLVPRILRGGATRDLSVDTVRAPPARPAPARPRGRARPRPPAGRPRRSAGRRRAGRAVRVLVAGERTHGNVRRRDGRRAAPLPALLEHRRCRDRELRAPRRSLRLRRDRAHGRHHAPRLAPARPRRRLPALSPRARPCAVPLRSGVHGEAGGGRSRRRPPKRRACPRPSCARSRNCAAACRAASGGPARRWRALWPPTHARPSRGTTSNASCA